MWTFFRIPENASEVFQREYDQAEAAGYGVYAREARSVLTEWKRDWKEFDPFRLQQYCGCHEAFRTLLWRMYPDDSPYPWGAKDERFLDGLCSNSVQPDTALWWAIGPERASLIPGCFGNIYVPAVKVSEVKPRVEAALDMSDPFFAARASDLLIDDDPPRLSVILPEVLDRVDRSGDGVLALVGSLSDSPSDLLQTSDPG